MTFSAMLKKYDAYVDTFRLEDGTLPKMMQLKRFHTDKVIENARLIAEGEAFSAELTEEALIAALLHDAGRYEQLKRYNTFRDSESVDHAVLSHEIVKKWEPEREVGAGWERVLKAVLYHNRRELPEGLDENELKLAHIVRDADKLDIFRVLEDQIEHTDWQKDKRAFWNLALEEKPNPLVVEAIKSGRPVDYQNIKSLSDFVLIQVGWIVSGLHFATSRALVKARGHLEYRREFLKKLTDSPEIDIICDLAT